MKRFLQELVLLWWQEESEVRFCAVRWATSLFDFQHCPSRFICMLGASDAKLDIRYNKFLLQCADMLWSAKTHLKGFASRDWVALVKWCFPLLFMFSFYFKWAHCPPISVIIFSLSDWICSINKKRKTVSIMVVFSSLKNCTMICLHVFSKVGAQWENEPFRHCFFIQSVIKPMSSLISLKITVLWSMETKL